MTGLYVETGGEGPALVLLHGWGLNVRVWDPLAQALGGRLRLIAVDLPGHGHSPWQPAHATARRQVQCISAAVAPLLGHKPYALLGWSLGAELALQWASARPQSLERLVLFAATPRFTSAPDWPYGAPADRLERLAQGLRSDYRRTVSDFLELQVRGSASGERVLAQLRAALFAHGGARPEALAAGLDILRETDLRAVMGDIDIPALVVAGQYDRVLLPAASRALAQAMPRARYVEIRRAAHAPFLSHAREAAALMTEFLES
jgi:pimeloyl-[acyl-carrier protein] methyl ester esterase